MRTLWFVLFLAGCGQTSDAPPKETEAPVRWKAAYSAAECEALIEKEAVLQRCFGGHFHPKNYVGDLKCMPYSTPQRLTGVWVIGLEYSAFFPGAASYKDTQDRPNRVWLQAEPRSSPAIAAALQGGGTRAYAIDLVGRRSLCDANYGHMGMSPQEVVAEQIITLRPLAGPTG